MHTDHEAIVRILATSKALRSFQGQVEAWEDRHRSAEAWIQYASSRPRGAIERLETSPKRADMDGDERVSLVWMAKPWRWRIQTSPPAAPHLATVIVNEGRWWLYDGKHEVATNEGSERRNRDATGLDRRLIAMLFPETLAETHSFQIQGQQSVMGMEAIALRARPTEASSSPWAAATEVALFVDGEHGVILSWTAYRGDSPYSSMNMRDFEFDLTLADELFTFRPKGAIKIRHFDDGG